MEIDIVHQQFETHRFVAVQPIEYPTKFRPPGSKRLWYKSVFKV